MRTSGCSCSSRFCSFASRGDRAYLAEGEVYITGRFKDIIIRGGRNIYPHELEDAVGAVAGVRRGCVAAFGSRDPHAGTERLVVLAETRETDPAARDALRVRISGTVHDVLGEPTHDFCAGRVHFTPGSAAIHVLDGETGAIRPPDTADYVRYAQLVAGLPRLEAQSTAFIPADVPSRISDSYRLFLSLLYGEKPVVTGAFTSEAFAGVTRRSTGPPLHMTHSSLFISLISASLSIRSQGGPVNSVR